MSNIQASTNYFERTFAFDIRSLALFRIILGLLVLSDLGFRFPTLVDMYTGQGLFTRDLSFQYYDIHLGANWPGFVWSLFWLSDSPAFTYGLFAIAAVAAIFLIVGKWSRIAVIVCWLIIASIHVRNPLVTSSADFMFKMMLFWSIFLPLGAKCSMDAKLYDRTQSNYCSVATVCYTIQLFALYFFPGVAKWNEIWLNGDAMSFVLRLDIYIREFGRVMLGYPEILKIISWFTLFAEVFLIWTLFVSWRNSFWRMVNLVVFVTFHLVIAMSMGIGLFPWICIIAWLPLLPGSIWQRFGWTNETEEPNQDANPDNGRDGFGFNNKSSFRLFSELFCFVAIAIVVLWNVSNIEHPAFQRLRIPIVKQLGYQLALDQHFQMFGIPPDENPWFVYEGLLPKGQKMDIWTGKPIDHAKPDSGLQEFPNFHWRKLHRNAIHSSNQFVRQPLLEYVVNKWNLHHNEEAQVGKARLICYRQPIGPDFNESDKYSHIWANVSIKGSQGSLFDSLIEDDNELGF